jgi:DNA-directed RNA polymerase subunit RPC12/RpoP
MKIRCPRCFHKDNPLQSVCEENIHFSVISCRYCRYALAVVKNYDSYLKTEQKLYVNEYKKDKS